MGKIWSHNANYIIRIFVFMILAISCRETRPTRKPSVPPDPMAVWLADFPGELLTAEPFEPVTCWQSESTPGFVGPKVPIPDLPGACVVERWDNASDALVDRWVFDQGRLIWREELVSDRSTRLWRWEHDTKENAIVETVCLTAQAGKSLRHPSWREPMVYYENDTTITTRTHQIFQNGLSVPVAGSIVSTTRYADREVTTGLRVARRLDRRGRVLARYQIYRMSDRPLALDTTVRRYRYRGDKLASITFEARNFDRYPDGRVPSVRYRNTWQVAFIHDPQGRIVETEASGSKTRLSWDKKGRLVQYNSATMNWDEQNRLVFLYLGNPSVNARFVYDASGRFVGANHDDGGGYRMEYGKACGSGFIHGALTPNVDNFLFYEGRNHL